MKSRVTRKLRYKQSHVTSISNPGIAGINLKMAQQFARWLVAQNYAPSTQQRYFRIAKGF
jgi:hypothetical protein